MKLGISYNVFDGEELLEGSIKQIRDQVDYISVLCQTTSNFGKPCSDDLLHLLKKLKKEKLVDDVFHYTPVIEKGGHFNEIQKRNIGLQMSSKVNCTHHMSMDCDEYYITSEFQALKKEVEDGDYDSSYCQLLTYYKSWDYILDPPEDYYVSLIYKINSNSRFDFVQSPVFNDPTRRLSGVKKPLILSRKKIQMHHGSYIRNDLSIKLQNSSALPNFYKDIQSVSEYHKNWQYPKPALIAGLPCTYVNLKQVNPLF